LTLEKPTSLGLSALSFKIQYSVPVTDDCTGYSCSGLQAPVEPQPFACIISSTMLHSLNSTNFRSAAGNASHFPYPPSYACCSWDERLSSERSKRKNARQARFWSECCIGRSFKYSYTSDTRFKIIWAGWCDVPPSPASRRVYRCRYHPQPRSSRFNLWPTAASLLSPRHLP